MLLTLYVVTTYVYCVQGNNLQEAERLLKDKLSSYNRHLRPVLNQSDPVKVSFGLHLINVKDFDEVAGRISISAIAALQWTDERMAWNRTEYGGINTIQIMDTGEVWTPTFVLVNSYDKRTDTGDNNFVIRGNSSGYMEYFPIVTFSAACKVDITYYPWDTQTCMFRFGCWGFYKEEVQLRLSNDVAATSFFTPNGLWNLSEASLVMEIDSVADFYLTLRRQPWFVFVNVILPIVLMSALNLFAFLIPIESGERLSYCITVLLSIAVFLTIVGDNLPKTSKPMAILSHYIVSMIVISIAITIANICSQRTYFRNEQEQVCPFWKRIVRLLSYKCLSMRRQKGSNCNGVLKQCCRLKQFQYKECSCRQTCRPSETGLEGISTKGTLKVSPKSFTTAESPGLSEVSVASLQANNTDPQMADFGNRQNETLDVPDTDEITWHDISAVIDRVCFSIFLITYACCSCSFLLKIAMDS